MVCPTVVCRLLRGTVSITVGALLIAAAVPGCDKKESADSGAAAAGGGKTVTIGFVYVGSEHDFGYNQAHHEGALAVKAIPGVKIIEQENVPETIEVEKAMESMIKIDGATILFPTSYGYFDPSVLKVAPKFPSDDFLHCGGHYVEGKTPSNVSTFFGYIDECEYLSGIVAAYTSKSKKLGFIAAKPIPQVLRDINALTLGAQSVHPDITTTVIFTGDWFLPVKEAEATNSLIAQGCDVITMHVDSPKTIIETAGKAKAFVTGYHANGAPLAPDYYLTGAEWNWATPYTEYVNTIKDGKPLPHMLWGGMKKGYVKMSPYGPAVSDEAKKVADAAKAKIMDGNFIIFKGPLKDNNGKELYKDGETHIQDDDALQGMDYLVAGVVGDAPNKK